MDAIECIKTRMSIRKFKPEPVPKEVLLEVINTAKWSPSYKNTQPWGAVIVSGEKKDEVSRLLIGLLENGAEPCPDLPAPESWPAPEAARIDHLFKKRSEATGIDMNDPETLIKGKKANFSFYGAPHAIYLFQDASLTHGLGTVPQAFVTDYAQDVKKLLSIPETNRLVLGISIGYPDTEAPVNAFRTDRVESDQIVKWIE
jgi:nitroreductase